MLGERDLTSRQVGKLERRCGRARLQTLALNSTLRDRSLRFEARMVAGGVRGELRDITRSDRDRLGDAAFLVEQIRNGSSHVREALHGPAIRLQKHAAREPMLLDEDRKSTRLNSPP